VPEDTSLPAGTGLAMVAIPLVGWFA
jgi:hypothetical protein